MRLFKQFLIILCFIIAPFNIADTKLIILGSGTPNPDPDRGGSGYAVIVNSQIFLVDFGVGIIRNAAKISTNWGGSIEDLSVVNIEHAFLTHIHSDHTMGLADLLLTPWVMGRINPVKLFGPVGLEEMAKNTIAAYQEDINYRINGTQPANKTGFLFEFNELREGIIFSNQDITVEAFKVDHGDFNDAYGFKFTTQDKVIVFSGDTGVSKNLEKYSQNVDILVHEVYSQAGFEKKTPDWQRYHRAHHTSTLELGEIANRTQPKKLVLSHILFWGSSPQDILNEVAGVYPGQVIIAEDGMIIE